MATITDNTGTESIVDVAGTLFTKTVFSSYRNYRSADGNIFVGQQPSKLWSVSIRNADGEFDRRSQRPERFIKPEEALAFAVEVTA